jgi:tellurite resistance protein
MTEAERDTADTTIAVCKCGGIVIAAVSNYIDRSTRKDLMDAVSDGCELKHAEAQAVRRMSWGCKCKEDA